MKKLLWPFFFFLMFQQTSAQKPLPAPLAHEIPKELKNVGITEKRGAKIDLSTTFKKENGKTVSLAQLFETKKPVLMTVVYYDCPSLCNYHLNGLLDVFKEMNWTAGKDFTFIALSMDEKETPQIASPKKQNYLKAFGRIDAGSGWHFLTGTKANIKKITNQIGFQFEWNEKQKQFAHASAATLLTPQGEVSRYFYGVEFNPKDLRLALVEAGKGRIGNFIDQLILYCFQFDPSKNKYTLYALNIMRLAGLAFVIVLGFILVPLWRRNLRTPS